MGYETMGEPSSPDDVYVCGKYNHLRSLCGQWVPRFKYDNREEWFPYSPTDSPRIDRHRTQYDPRTQTLIPEYTETILHPPIYFDTNGNRLPGNRKNPPKKVGRSSKQLEAFNFYSGGTFTGIICPAVIIFSIIASFIFNKGYTIWLFTIPGLLIAYNYGKNVVYHYLNDPLYDNNIVDMGCYGDEIEIPYYKEEEA